MSKWHDFISHEKKNGIRRGLSASINALSGLSNGLMNILFILIWMNRCCVHWLLSSRAENQKNVLNQNIQAGKSHSEPGKQKQICSLLLMLDGFFEKKMQISTQ